ncbi:MAG: ABC transporter permease [Phycisphaerae bacterium]|nr:ABC transporter permease [Phycisphaerae bacterium]
MGTLWQDMRYGLRMLVKNPGFTAIALITLAIGIGANTVMFSVVNVLLFRPTQVMDPDQLVVCNFRNVYGSSRYSAYVDVRDNNAAFTDTMAYDSGFHPVTLVWGDVTRRVLPMFVSANYFSFLGVAPAYGRAFLPEEELYGAEPMVVLSHRIWQRHGADPNIVGAHVAINGTSFRIIGVATEGFTGTTVMGPDLWLPLGSYGLVGHLGREKSQRLPSELWNYPDDITPVGRLKPGLTTFAAQARLQSLVPRLKENHPRWWREHSSLHLSRPPRLNVASRQDDRSSLSLASLFLMGLSAVVLLISCLNLANMLIVRGAGRHREIAIRMAIGGGRLRIVQQLLIESLLLAILGGAFGLILAFWGTRILNAWMGSLQLPIDLTGSLRTDLDVRVLAGTLGFCLIAAVLSGLKPALRLSRREVAADLKESRGEVLRSTGRVRRPRGLSIVCQIALSVVLVMGAALFTRSALHTAWANSGFDVGGKLLIELDPLAAGYDLARAQQVYETLAERLKSMPGVQAVGLSASFPFAMDGSSATSVSEYAPGVEKDQRDEEQVMREMIANPPVRTDTMYSAGEDYFEAMGITLLQGRSFDRLDSVSSGERVLIIDERIARRLRPDGSALDCLVQCHLPLPSSPYRVVGIVPHVPTILDEKDNRGQVYAPIGHDRLPAYIHLRVASTMRGAEAVLLRQIPVEIREVDSHLPILSVITLADCCRNHPYMWAAGIGARLAVTFGGIALFLASLGIYAIKGYMVASRTPEIGIRKALGATHWAIMGMVFREGMALTAIGLIVGLFLAFAAGRLIGSLLYGVSPVDPLSIAVALALLGIASMLASYIPARRAAKIDPMEALRYE